MSFLGFGKSPAQKKLEQLQAKCTKSIHLLERSSNQGEIISAFEKIVGIWAGENIGRAAIMYRDESKISGSQANACKNAFLIELKNLLMATERGFPY
jgi:hypothetical protein